MTQLPLFGECTAAELRKERNGWRASCGCGWCGYIVQLKEFARDELHAHLRSTLQLTAYPADSKL